MEPSPGSDARVFPPATTFTRNPATHANISFGGATGQLSLPPASGGADAVLRTSAWVQFDFALGWLRGYVEMQCEHDESDQEVSTPIRIEGIVLNLDGQEAACWVGDPAFIDTTWMPAATDWRQATKGVAQVFAFASVRSATGEIYSLPVASTTVDIGTISAPSGERDIVDLALGLDEGRPGTPSSPQTE